MRTLLCLPLLLAACGQPTVAGTYTVQAYRTGGSCRTCKASGRSTFRVVERPDGQVRVYSEEGTESEVVRKGRSLAWTEVGWADGCLVATTANVTVDDDGMRGTADGTITCTGQSCSCSFAVSPG